MKNNIVIVGASGYWGSIITRAAVEVFGADHIIALDINITGLHSLAQRLVYEGVLPNPNALHITDDFEQTIADTSNQSFVIATPPTNHYQLSKEVLINNKNIIITKPVALSRIEAEQLRDLATERGVIAMVDNTFIFHPGVQAMVKEVKNGTVGTAKTIYANWLSRGKIQNNVNVLWDLAPHPLSILLELWNFPIKVSCTQLDSIDGVVTEASMFLNEVRTGNTARLHISWVDSDKSRTFKIRGSHNSIIFDDTKENSSKLQIKGGLVAGDRFLNTGYEGAIEKLEYLRSKQIAFEWEEPLKKELVYFGQLVKQKSNPGIKSMINSIANGADCVKIIEAAEDSMTRSMAITVDQ